MHELNNQLTSKINFKEKLFHLWHFHIHRLQMIICLWPNQSIKEMDQIVQELAVDLEDLIIDLILKEGPPDRSMLSQTQEQ